MKVVTAKEHISNIEKICKKSEEYYNLGERKENEH